MFPLPPAILIGVASHVAFGPYGLAAAVDASVSDCMAQDKGGSSVSLETIHDEVVLMQARKANMTAGANRMVRHNKSLYKSGVPLDVEKPFNSFQIQCSHNTYLWGVQSGDLASAPLHSANAMAYTNALHLGYRCLEIDVWPNSQNPSSAERMYVLHAAHVPLTSKIKYMSNIVSFDLVLQAIAHWCRVDEETEADRPHRYPLLISIENHAKRTEDLQWMAERLQANLGDRIIGLGHGGLTIHEAMSAFAPNNAPRSILIKSDKLSKEMAAKSGMEDPHWTSLIFLPKSVSPSAQMPKGVSEVPPTIDFTKIAGKEDKANNNILAWSANNDKLVRVYPHSSETESSNYAPWIPWKLWQDNGVGPQMVCINVPGRCPTFNAVPRKYGRCEHPVPTAMGQPQGTCTSNTVPPACQTCACQREFAANLERAFHESGDDGYMDFLSLGDPEKQRVMELLSTSGL